ncbi:MAG: glycosyltransferase family 4 protein, partial [Thermosynechococcaceae cyanobacterium]
MLTTFYPPYHHGGDATYVRALARALTQRGHAVEVVHCEDAYSIRRGYRTAPPPEEDGIVVHRLRSRWKLLSPLLTQQTGHPVLKTQKLQAILQRRFDVIHFHNISLIGGPAILGMGQALVKLYTLHEHWLLCPMHIFWKNRQQACDRPECIRCCLRSGIPPQWWRYTSLLQESTAKLDAFLAPSEYTANRHRAAGFSIPIHLHPLFSTLDPGAPPPFVAGKRPKFLYVGRITAAKGILPLLKIFAELTDYDLDVVGDGDLRPQLQQAYQNHANIYFWGQMSQQQLIARYQGATALIFPSLAPETFGLVIVEAFACGTPVIAHNAGGSRELIEKTGAGFVYESESELISAIHTLAQTPGLRQELGARAYQSYQQNYTEKTHVDAYLQHIQMIQ